MGSAPAERFASPFCLPGVFDLPWKDEEVLVIERVHNRSPLGPSIVREPMKYITAKVVRLEVAETTPDRFPIPEKTYVSPQRPLVAPIVSMVCVEIHSIDCLVCQQLSRVDWLQYPLIQNNLY